MNVINKSFPLDLLSEGSKRTHLEDSVVDNMKQLIINAFAQNSIDIISISYVTSPSVVRFEFTPSPGIKMSNIRSCKDDLAEALADYGSVRLIAPVPGKGTIAVEVPRPDRQIVRLKEVLESKEFQDSKAHLPIALGIDSENNTIVADLAKLPHLLIAGEIGQGKSVLINNIIVSLLYRLCPADLKFVLIDPKQVEFAHYNTFKNKYLLHVGEPSSEVVTEIEKVPDILISIYYEVRHRYDLLRISKCRTIYEYNQKFAEGKLSEPQHHHLPYIVIVIDEFADLMITFGQDFVCPLLQIVARARAVGIHLVIATQRPSTDTITGIIKANFPARIAFKVRSEIDSKTILDINGAEKLLGMGDMLLMDNCSTNRIQGCFVSTYEIKSICEWIAQKLSFFFKHLFELLTSEDDEEEDDDSKDTVSIDAVMKEDDHKGEMSFAELLDLIDLALIDEEYSPCEYKKLPYEDYEIIGDTAEIDKMCRSNGSINLDIPDFMSTLSKDTVNYVSTGSAEGPDCVVNALADALHKLPIEIEAISKLLFNVWTPDDMQFPMNEMKSMADFINVLSEDIDVVWGCAYDEALEAQQAKVSLIAASK